MFFEQNAVEPNIGVNRVVLTLLKKDGLDQVLHYNRRRALAALAAMERHLDSRDFFVGERYSIADIALYAYTHLATEGGFDLEPYPAVRRWLERVRAEPGHVPMLG